MQPPDRPLVVVKKYGDRRLYDASASRYVKLDDIAQMIRDGIDVQVLDARTGKDLTYMILTQIVVEGARERETALPLQLLRQLIQASDRATHDFLSWYLNSALDLYQKAEEGVRSRFSEAKSIVSSPLGFVRNLIPGQQPPADTGEVARLQRRVEELESQLSRKTSRRGARKKSRS